MSEQDFHRAVAQYLDLALGPECWWTTIGHGGGGKVRGALLKAMGVKPGVPDILIRWYGWAGWIELKAPYGVVSREQKQVHLRLNQLGDSVLVARDLPAIEAWLIENRVPLKARL